MMLGIYSVFDSKAAAFLPPFFVHNDAIAQRAFSEGANDPTHPFFKHPADYTLFRIGDFNDTTGQVVALDVNVNLGHSAQYKE